MVVVPFIGFVLATYFFVPVPDAFQVARNQRVTVVDHEGKRVGHIFSEADRVSVPLDQMPEHLRNAILAVEDRRFYDHVGVSPTSILRAAIANVFGERQGGSTITQQYVKNAYVGNERTIRRKVKEAILAIKLERQKSKDEILELYINTVYLGRGVYGCEAAAKVYFNRRCKDLDLRQSALLAAVIKAPSSYDPTRNPEGAKERRDLVLALMQREGHITEEQRERAARRGLGARAPRQRHRMAPHFLQEIKDFLESKVDARILYGGGVRVETTLDVDMQRAAEAAVAAVRRPRNDPEAALVAVDPEDGGVRAMVGSRNFATRQLNLAQRRRQPGSTFKPLVLATALDEGMSPEERIPAPATLRIGGGSVSNYDRRDHGRLTIRRATELSVNTVYVELIRRVGVADVADMGRSLGIGSPLDPDEHGVSLALGSAVVTPLELTGAYATFAARGMRATPYMVSRVRHPEHGVLYEQDPETERAIEQDVADGVNDVLQGVITRGTATAAAIGRPAAGKTGTTDDCKDVWFSGYTPDLAATVWNGRPDNRSMREDGRCPIFGGTFSALIWQRFMQEALRDVPPTQFVRPKGVRPTGDPTPTGEPTSDATPTTGPTLSPGPPPSPSPSGSGDGVVSPAPTPKPTTSPSPITTVSPSPETG